MSVDIALDEVIYLEGITSGSTGAATDADSTPTFEVFEESTDTDIGVGGNMTKRTSKTGDYRASFTQSAANGFELGKMYSAIGSATIGGVAVKGILKTWRCVAAEAVAGYPKIDAHYWKGSVLNDLISGRADVTVGAMQSNVLTAAATHSDWLTELRTYLHGGDWAADMSSDGRHRITDGTGAGELDTLSGTVLLRSANEQIFADLTDGGRLDLIFDATLADTDSLDTTKITSTRAGYLDGLAMTGTGTTILNLLRLIARQDSAVGTDLSSALAVLNANLGSGAGAFNPQLDSIEKASSNALTASTNTTSIFTDTQDILSRLPAALISGRMDVTVGAMQANVMTAAASAADLISEIQASITGGAYAFNTDANGNVRIVDGTGTGEIDTASGLVRLSSTGVDDIWDEVVQGAYTARQSMRLQNAAAGGKSSGALTSNFLIRNLSDTLNAIDATVDGDGNRAAITLDLSA